MEGRYVSVKETAKRRIQNGHPSAGGKIFKLESAMVKYPLMPNPQMDDSESDYLRRVMEEMVTNFWFQALTNRIEEMIESVEDRPRKNNRTGR